MYHFRSHPAGLVTLPDGSVLQFVRWLLTSPVKKVIHWFRRDLRVSDNVALSEAASRAEQVVPVFVLEDAFQTGPDVGAARAAFLLRSVDSLRKSLAVLGYPLVIRRGKSVEAIPALDRKSVV